MSVAQFFEGKNIFITGGTGFMGKLLIEKLLRSCPGIGKIYVLLRSKRGRNVEERLKQLVDGEVFDKIRENNPDALDKIIGIGGNVAELNLGLSDSDRQLLVDNVNIIYHSAASVRFDDFLDESILMNIRGTREIAQLALDLKNPTILVHVSTAYCNGDRYEVDEKLYPPHGDWRDAILSAETCDKELIHIMSEKYIYPHVNTYTFAKGLAEHVITDMCKGKTQAMITRPSVVVNTLDEPLAGWNDNLNGPIGLMIAGGKGILRLSIGRYNNTLNYIPADVAIKGIILATYDNFIKNNSDDVEIYNITQRIIKCSHGQFIDEANKMNLISPVPNIVWYPRNFVTSCYYNYYLQVIFFHLLPAIFWDILLKLFKKKPMVVKIQRKIYTANYILGHFTLPNFTFKNNKMIEMQENLVKTNPDFGYPFELSKEGLFNYLVMSEKGVIKYVLKESMDPTGETEKKRLRRFKIADIIWRTFIFSFACWLFFIRFNTVQYITNGIYDYFQNL
ncbi:fatty acyl-CoA reductase 1-like [Diorhabda sublineata]|uniref:fatty acyl-CoA reductase 1-like n=1 Tax=Diorhabda sublineata TaxID=1163346 RepID=UPI0024E075EB|nr:fatty acyl-CoA reductase 1-like [Diorhabda sublineata]XP_056640852.1 fatty acyl-CoA reductase 1-like [Diorhabda sublineata]XP_056640853.1 fatty acyl-CoA reductase 1-like [Diorhabda sublineata]XP_056640854.1 fatty acyl-CoA reductase 1-like [Diorhabda sublineata]